MKNNQQNQHCDYIIQTASAHMPGSCKGHYKRIGLLCVDKGVKCVSMISPRAKGVRHVVETWERLNVGHTDRCAYQRALKEARDKQARCRGRVALDRLASGRLRVGVLSCDICEQELPDDFDYPYGMYFVTPSGDLVCPDCWDVKDE